MAASLSLPLEGLALALSAEVAAYDEMAGLSEALRDAIVRGDLEAVNALTGRQRALMERIDGIEAKRERVTRRIASACGEDEAVMSMARVVAMADEAQARRLQTVGEALKAAVERQRTLNDINMTLMRTTLSVTESVINALTGTDTLNNIYTSGGSQSQPAHHTKRDFFNREI